MTDGIEECGICEKPIDEELDDYEIIELYQNGGFEDYTYIHVDCRYKADKEKAHAVQIKKRIEEAYNYRYESMQRQKKDKTIISPWEFSEYKLLKELLGESENEPK